MLDDLAQTDAAVLEDHAEGRPDVGHLEREVSVTSAVGRRRGGLFEVPITEDLEGRSALAMAREPEVNAFEVRVLQPGSRVEPSARQVSWRGGRRAAEDVDVERGQALVVLRHQVGMGVASVHGHAPLFKTETPRLASDMGGRMPMGMVKTSTLIASDAGVAGRDLLEHRDINLFWALTEDEVKAVLSHKRPRLVVTREDLALSVFEGRRASGVRPPVVVLVEPDGWARHEAYQMAGATALVRSSNRRGILEAVSEVSGRDFVDHPWVALEEVVSIELEDRERYVEIRRLSPSGIELNDAPDVKVGARVKVSLDFLDRPLSLPGLVVRHGQARGHVHTGIVFDRLDESTRSELEAIVSGRARTLPEPMDFTEDLGTYTLDLFRQAAPAADSFAERRELVARALFPVEGSEQARVPRWVSKVAESLTSVERDTMLDRTGPEFARDALELRIRLASWRLAQEPDDEVRTLFDLVLDFARTLAVEGAALPPEQKVDVTTIRADLLARVYRMGQPVSRPARPLEHAVV